MRDRSNDFHVSGPAPGDADDQSLIGSVAIDPGWVDRPVDGSPGEAARSAAMEELGRPGPDRTALDRVVEMVAQRRRSPWVQGVALVLVATAVVGSWTLLRRPPSASGALPRASASSLDGSGSHAKKATPSTALLEPTGGSGSNTDATSAGRSASGQSPTTTGAAVTIHVAGAVLHPGVVTLASGSRAVDAIDAAGGLAPGADADRINLAAQIVDGSRLVVPLIGQPVPAEVVPQRPAGSSGGGVGSAAASGAPGAAATAPVDVNSADVGQLDALPGIGPSTAAAIVAYREQHGPFSSVDGLLDVRGIGDAKLDGLRDLVSVGS